MNVFPPFRLDLNNQCLWRQAGEQERRIELTPKAFAVLKYLVEHSPRLVTHRELLDAVWPHRVVQPEVLSSHVRDLRHALGDDAKKPKFIETLARRGYRFVAALNESVAAAPGPAGLSLARLVGRDSALAELDEYLTTSLDRKRQVVFVTGEPGIGKTALVDEFHRRACIRLPALRSARGQCIEGYGGHEAYYPILKAVGEMCRGPGGDSIVRTLAAQAPTWLIQFPALLSQEHRRVLQREILGATGARMLREIGEALETITAASPLLMILEDLQWADFSTLDFISEIARRRDAARFMLVVTYRPLDATPANHPLQALKLDLRVHNLCHEIALRPLGETDIAEYLGTSTAAARQQGDLARILHRHSEGNPLFMVAALDEMNERKLVARQDGEWRATVPLQQIDIQVPESLRQMIDAQIERLRPDEQRALEAAAVTGMTFSSRLSASAVGLTSQEFEDICEPLARREHIVRTAGTQRFPDGTVSPRYEFVHILYREVLSRRQTPGLASARHGRVAERMESLYARDAREVASELAEHFTESLDWSRAIQYLRLAAETAQHRFALREAEALLQRALKFVQRVPMAERGALETDILERLATTYVASFDVRCIETYETLRMRAAHHGLVEVEIRALVDLSYCLSWISAERALEALEQALRLSDGLPDALLRACMRMNCLVGRVWVGGWNSKDAQEARDALITIRSARDRTLLAPHLIGYSHIQWIFSEYREAYECAVEGLAILTENGGDNPYLSIPFQRGQIVLPRSLLFLGEWGHALHEIDAAITIAAKNGDYLPTQILRLNRAWIHLEAMDFAGVLESCELVTRSGDHFASGYLRRFSSILAGAAEAALGRHERALETLSAAKQSMENHAILGDWYFRMPVELALLELWLSRGDLAAARRVAGRLLDAALATEERTWQGLAWEAAARVAAAEGNLEHARECADKALTTIEGREVPLAAWRVHATAAELCVHPAEDERRRRHAEVSRGILMKLADSLAGEESLRKAFLSAPRVSQIYNAIVDD